jgi:predicted DNA-binding protein (MmcQ/YjbR family)
MTAEKIRDLCLSLKGVEETIKWENHLCFTIGEKMFLVITPDSVPVNGSFKTTPENFDTLTSREGIIPAPYLAKHNWVHFDKPDRLSMKEWKQYIKLAYELTFEKLPLKMRKKIENAS